MRRRPKVVILVPRRNDGGHRDAVWAYCRARWEADFPDWPIFEGHHDEGLFNRSAAVNRAAAGAGDWDIAVLIDSDVLVDPAQVREALDVVRQTGDHLVLPFSVRHNLSRQGSQRVMGGEQGSWRSFIAITYRQQCSAVVVIPRALWDQVGGFDEQFVGWGYEDNAFAASCETYGGAGVELLPGELWHLWHPTAKEGKRTSPSYRANRARHELYRAAMGDPDKIRALMAGGSEPIVEIRERENIPRILHRVVPERTTPEVEGWWRRFEELHPGWQLMTHRDPLNPEEWPLTGPSWPKCTTGAQLAGLIRLEALYRWGGVYVDSDCEPYRSLEPLLPLRAFAAWEDAKVVPDAVLGAEPEHPAIKACIDLALRKLKGGAWASGPGVTTAILPRRSDVTVLPPGAFYPYHYTEKGRRGEDHAKAQPWAYMAHHWAGSWLANSPPAATAKLSILVPFRDADGTRTEAKEWILKRWAHHWPDAEIIVASDDGVNPFNKPMAVNNAAAQATGDIYVILDADTWIDPAWLHKSIEALQAGAAQWAVPSRHIRLKQGASNELLALDPTAPLPIVKPGDAESFGPVVGFLWVILASAFWDMAWHNEQGVPRGMDERIRGWGGEDTAFRRAAMSIIGRPKRILGTVLCLWHARPRTPLGRHWEGQDRTLEADKGELMHRYRRAMNRKTAMRQLLGQP